MLRRLDREAFVGRSTLLIPPIDALDDAFRWLASSCSLAATSCSATLLVIIPPRLRRAAAAVGLSATAKARNTVGMKAGRVCSGELQLIAPFCISICISLDVTRGTAALIAAVRAVFVFKLCALHVTLFQARSRWTSLGGKHSSPPGRDVLGCTAEASLYIGASKLAILTAGSAACFLGVKNVLKRCCCASLNCDIDWARLAVVGTKRRSLTVGIVSSLGAAGAVLGGASEAKPKPTVPP